VEKELNTLMLREIWTVLDRKQRIGFVSLILLSFVSVLAELFGLGAVFVLSTSIWMPSHGGGLHGFAARMLGSSFLAMPSAKFILAGAVVGAYLLKTALAIGVSRLRAVYVQRQHAAFSERLLRKYLGKDWLIIVDQNIAVLTRQVLSDCDHISTVMLNELLIFITELSIAVALLGAMLIISPVAVALMSAFLLMVAAPLRWFQRPWIRRLGAQTHAARIRTARTVDMALRSTREIALYNLSGFFVERLHEDLKSLTDAEALTLTLRESPRYFIELLAVVAFMSVLAFEFSGGTPVESASVIVWVIAAASYRLIMSTSRMSSAAVQIGNLRAMLTKLRADLVVNESDVDGLPPADLPIDHRSSLELRHVCFQYPGSAVPALHDISATIAFGQTVGIVGPSGAGKSTLLELLLGILTAQSGTVLIDGRPMLPEVRHAWRRKVSYVPQKFYLANDTVAQNIAFGIRKEAIDQVALREAAALAGIDRFIETELPDGYSTVIGDTGATLAGGQQQRIAIARALYRRPELLVLDEATSALDNVTENIVNTAIANLGRKMTVLIVAHRLSTVRRCDLILVLERGRLIQSGTFTELSNQSGAFHEQWAAENAPATRDGGD